MKKLILSMAFLAVTGGVAAAAVLLPPEPDCYCDKHSCTCDQPSANK